MLELLVALTILVTAFAIIWSTFSATVRGWKRGSELLDELHHGEIVMEQIVAALRSTAFFDNNPGVYGFQLKNSGGGLGGEDSISFVTSGSAFIPPDSPLANGLHRIVIGIGDNKDGKPAVAIQAYPHLADPEEIDVDTWYVSSEVKGFNCRVYVLEEDAEKSSDGDWEDEWEDTNAIPSLVEINLFMDPLEEFGEPLKLTRLVEIPVAPALRGAVVMDGGGRGGSGSGSGSGGGATGGAGGSGTGGGGAAAGTGERQPRDGRGPAWRAGASPVKAPEDSSPTLKVGRPGQ